MKKVNLSLGILVAAILVMASIGGMITTITTIQSAHAQAAAKKVLGFGFGGGVDDRKAPIATFGNNVYVTWWTNKSGDSEVMFKASNDGGKTFGSKINLSNSPGIRSDNAEIAASGNNVYVSWWERANQTSDEPVLRVSNDNGKTFGQMVMINSNSTAARSGSPPSS